jgi:PiT family inorganic phosphate transporter
MLLTLLFLAALFLAYTNGANDNFKGVATLYGSKTLDYRQALTLTTIATFAGSVSSIFLADTLVANFSGKGLVPDGIAGSADFLLSVAAGAGVTVLLATLFGFPVSTTHGLTGALVGAGFVAVGNEVNLALLGNKFFLPLLISPLIAMLLGTLVYFTLNYFGVFFGINQKQCVCLGSAGLGAWCRYWLLLVLVVLALTPIPTPTLTLTPRPIPRPTLAPRPISALTPIETP